MVSRPIVRDTGVDRVEYLNGVLVRPLGHWLIDNFFYFHPLRQLVSFLNDFSVDLIPFRIFMIPNRSLMYFSFRNLSKNIL